MPEIVNIHDAFQYGGTIAIVVAALVGVVWKLFTGGGQESDHERDVREREERSRRYQLEREADMNDVRSEFNKVIEALREAIYYKIDQTAVALRSDMKAIDDRLRIVERDVAVILSRRPRNQ